MEASPRAEVKVVGKSGISQARSRLGPEPLKQVWEAAVCPIAEERTWGAWYRPWRLISLDGSTLDVADTAENEAAFGRLRIRRARRSCRRRERTRVAGGRLRRAINIVVVLAANGATVACSLYESAFPF